jgi:hypothetical protein
VVPAHINERIAASRRHAQRAAGGNQPNSRSLYADGRTPACGNGTVIIECDSRSRCLAAFTPSRPGGLDAWWPDGEKAVARQRQINPPQMRIPGSDGRIPRAGRGNLGNVATTRALLPRNVSRTVASDLTYIPVPRCLHQCSRTSTANSPRDAGSTTELDNLCAHCSDNWSTTDPQILSDLISY